MKDEQPPLIVPSPSDSSPAQATSAEQAEAAKGQRCGTVALVGRPNVGKSTLLNAVLGLKIAATTHKPQTTRRQLRGILTDHDSQIVFVDTPGLHQAQDGLHAFMIAQALDAARGVDLVVLVVEAYVKKEGGEKVALIDRRDEAAIEQLAQAGAMKRPVILCINKIDRIPDRAALLPLLASWSGPQWSGPEWSDKVTFSALVPVSAESKDGLPELLQSIRSQLPEGPFLFDPDSITDASEREIAGELIREKAMLELREEIPYKVAIVVEDFDESRREDKKKPLIRISAIIHVEREGQKRAVVGKGGSRVKAIGQRARKELETLLDCQVFLELFVRVEKDWTRTDKGLSKVGYKR